MNRFVVIFRQSATLNEVEKRRRAEETAAWARQLDAGSHLDPRILGPERELRGGMAPAGHDVTALLFLDAPDLREAARIAESHPGIRYGADVEVRPWAPPAAFSPSARERGKTA